MLPWRLLLLLLLVMSHSARAGELPVSSQRYPRLSAPSRPVVLAMGGHHLRPAPKGTGGDGDSSWVFSPGFFSQPRKKRDCPPLLGPGSAFRSCVRAGY